MIDKAIPQGLDGHLDNAQEEWLRLMPDGWDGTDYVSENASLRMERDFYFRQVEENSKRNQAAYESLGDENAKLRNLVVKAHTCERCCADCYQDEGCCPIEREMQELGIEVKQ